MDVRRVVIGVTTRILVLKFSCMTNILKITSLTFPSKQCTKLSQSKKCSLPGSITSWIRSEDFAHVPHAQGFARRRRTLQDLIPPKAFKNSQLATERAGTALCDVHAPPQLVPARSGASRTPRSLPRPTRLRARQGAGHPAGLRLPVGREFRSGRFSVSRG